MPVIANAVSAMGGNALAVAKASIMGQMTLGFPLSPLTGATFLLLGLSGQDLGDHQKHTPLRMGCICYYGRCGLRSLWAAVLRSHQKKHLPPFSPILSF